MSFAIVEEVGDYDPDFHTGDYVSSVKLVLRQTEQLDRKVIELHQKRDPGQESHIPVDEFMSIARGLETYGVDPHPVKVSQMESLIINKMIANLFKGSPRNSTLLRHKSFRHQYICSRQASPTFSMV